MPLRSVCVLGLVLVSVALAPPAAAEIVGEGVTALRCTEGSDLQMPKRMEFLQVILTDDLAAFDRVALIVEAEYAEAVGVNKGQLIVTVSLIKADGSETALGRLKAKMRDGEAFAEKLVDARVEKGDSLHWRVKVKKLPALLDELEDCFNAYFVAAVANEFPG